MLVKLLTYLISLVCFSQVSAALHMTLSVSRERYCL